MSFANLKVGTRLALGFGALTLMMIIVAVLGVTNMRTIQGEMDDIVNHEFPKTAVANNILESVSAIGIYMRDALLVTGQANVKKELDGVIANRAAIKENLDKLEALIAADANQAAAEEDRAALAKVIDARAKYVAAQEQFMKLMGEGRQAAARSFLMDEAMALQDDYIEKLHELVDYQTNVMKNIGEDASRQVRNILVVVIAFAALAVVFAIITGLLIARSITRPLQQAVEVAGAVSRGDLTRRIEVNSKDELGQLMQALKDMNESLEGIIGKDVGRVLDALSRGDLTEKITRDYPGIFGKLKDDANITVEKLTEIISQVKDSTDTINTAAQEIAQGNTDLSQRTEEQASSLEETASSMQELTSTVRQNAENARQANQLSMSASDIAVKGGKVVGEVVDTMASISTSSKKIVDIISVIEGIAFQTNILALNAAVEAARAGEQGRGFAVVAGEVRNLAQRSAAAAKEIKALIDDSVGKVDVGSKQVDQAGATMTEIVTAVKRVTDIMSEISAASNEQSAGIEQVNQAIVQMDEVTQQNAALVEEAAAAAESMQEQSKVLDDAMGTFRLGSGRGRMHAAVTKPGPAAKSDPATRHVAAPVKRVGKLLQGKSGKDGDWKEF